MMSRSMALSSWAFSANKRSQGPSDLQRVMKHGLDSRAADLLDSTSKLIVEPNLVTIFLAVITIDRPRDSDR